MQEIKVLELIRASDIFLIKFKCPKCGEECLCGVTEAFCIKCGFETKEFFYDLSSTHKRNICPVPHSKARKQLSKRVIVEILHEQNDQCAYCGQYLAGINYHIEHIVPLAAGGTNQRHNIALSCPKCNLVASSKVFPSMASKRVYILSQRRTRNSTKN